MKAPLTKSQFKALGVLIHTDYHNRTHSRDFARKMWGDTESNMFTTVKNTGNGATAGKAAWLCAGSYLGRLRQKGWVSVWYSDSAVEYWITAEGRKIYEEHIEYLKPKK